MEDVHRNTQMSAKIVIAEPPSSGPDVQTFVRALHHTEVQEEHHLLTQRHIQARLKFDLGTSHPLHPLTPKLSCFCLAKGEIFYQKNSPHSETRWREYNAVVQPHSLDELDPFATEE